MQSNLTLQQLRYITEVVECGSINAASQNLYVSQPALSTAIKDAEQELGIEIFNRSNRGITLTQEGVEFVGYARQVLEQVDLLEARYSGTGNKAVQKLSISSQHYAFCVKAFVDLVEEYDQDEYEFTLRETRTAEIIEDVKSYRSELGVLYLSNFNKRVISKALSDAGLEFVALFEAEPHVFVGEHHPLAQETSVKPEQLEDYTRYSFEQGAKQITYSDRGTLSNLLTNFDGYTIATGVLSDEMNAGIVAIPLEADEKMTVGYIHQAAHDLSELAKRYIKKLRAYIEANPTVTTYIEHPNAAGDEN